MNRTVLIAGAAVVLLLAVVGGAIFFLNNQGSGTSGQGQNQQAAQDYLWRVEGTNRTLNQNVVFSWNFVETNNAVVTSQLNTTSGTLNQDATKLQQFQMLLNNSAINGRAQLGPVQQIEVKAVPVK